jgi:enoyl-CoA hydratase/carnithine racemase
MFPYRKLEQYSQGLQRIKLERKDGILLVRFHNDDGPFSWNPRTHREVSMLWNDIGMDPENKVIILTGTGDSYLNRADYGDSLGAMEPQLWALGHQEGKKIMMDFLEIEQPVIAALNGPVSIHSQIPMMADIVLATPDAEISETHLHPGGVLPGDGHHVIWSVLLGVNRARALLLTGKALSAEEARALGVVHEIVERSTIVDRAMALAYDLLKLPSLTLRLQRPLMLQPIKKMMLEQLSHGLMLEGMTVLEKYNAAKAG